MLYWPPGAGGLRLFSSHRLPHVSELSHASDVPRIFRSPAAPGEIVVASSRPLVPGANDALAGMGDGGPVTLERIRAAARQVDGFVVEVR
jgi:hypothetical protein